MRIFVSVLATAAMFLGASTAGAVEFLIVGNDSATVLPGESVTIDIVMTNSTGEGVFGVAASVSGYDEGVVAFRDGQAVSGYLNQVCVGPGACFGGFSNLAGGALAESAIGANGNRVQIALSAGLAPVTNTGAVDQGLDNVEGSAMFTITFDTVGVGAGVTQILIGTSYQGDGITLAGGVQSQAQGATFTLSIVPEPGTALLMGLGLAGLAAAGRRE